MRLTKQKQLIFNIVDNSHDHLTAYEIYEKSKKVMPNISLGTVYRNLNKLVSLKMIRRLEFKDNIIHYDNKKEKHNHFICEKCHKIIDLKEKISLPKFNYQVNDYELNIYGICENCLKEEKNE